MTRRPSHVAGRSHVHTQPPKSPNTPTGARKRATLDTLPPGTRFGRYQLVRRLAVGGMAELYLARATGIEGFEKLVALKRILPQHAMHEDFVRMFLDEARLSATIQHANVAQVYDIGRCEDGLFFTMEYVHGEDVRTVMQTLSRRARTLPLEHALGIVIGAAAGLHAAHQKLGADGRPLGLVHRDVSPSNVLVSFDGCVKIIDFGIAKAARRQTETRAGTLKGKIAYMSPEQCLGESIDRRSDVFSLAVVLYEMTTGARLFPVDNEYAAMRQIVDVDAPPPSRRRPGYPPELEAIVMRALRRPKEERWGSAEELQLALEGFVRARGLAVSTAQLGYFMRDLFPDRAEPALDRMVLPLRPRLTPTPLPIDALPSRPPGDDLALPEEIAPEVAIGTWMFGANGSAPEGVRAIDDFDEPSISILVPQTRQHPHPRLRLALIGGVAASVAAVAAAVMVMIVALQVPMRATLPAPAPAPAPAAPPPAPALEAPAVAVPIPLPVPSTTPAKKKPARPRPKKAKKAIKETTWNPDSALPPP